MIAIVDIDGVLADASHRQHFVDARPKDWAAFFAAVGEDPVIPAGQAMLLSLSREHEVVLLSGRPEHTRRDTTEWLDRNGLPYTSLVLRPDSDHRPAALLKADLVRGIGGPEEVAVVVDDDASVTDRLAAAGYRVHVFP